MCICKIDKITFNSTAMDFLTTNNLLNIRIIRDKKKQNY